MRRLLAVKVDVLDPQRQMDLVEQTKPRILDGTMWYLADAATASSGCRAHRTSRPARQRLVALQRRQGHLRHERRRVIPTWPSHYTAPLRASSSPLRAGPLPIRQSHFSAPLLSVEFSFSLIFA